MKLKSVLLAFVPLLLSSVVRGESSNSASDDLAGLLTLRKGIIALEDLWDVKVDHCKWLGVSCQDGRVREINMNEYGMSGEIPLASLGRLSELSIVRLWRNNLTGLIPHDIDGAKELSIILLHYNKLSGEIPSSLGHLINLVQLNLSSNSLSGQIPSLLSHWPRSSFLYNRLCGRPLEDCPSPPPASSPDGRSTETPKIVGRVILLAILGVVLAAGVIVSLKSRAPVIISRANSISSLRDLESGSSLAGEEDDRAAAAVVEEGALVPAAAAYASVVGVEGVPLLAAAVPSHADEQDGFAVAVPAGGEEFVPVLVAATPAPAAAAGRQGGVAVPVEAVPPATAAIVVVNIPAATVAATPVLAPAVVAGREGVVLVAAVPAAAAAGEDGVSAAASAGEDGVSAAAPAVAATEGGNEGDPLPVAAAAASGDEGVILVPVVAVPAAAAETAAAAGEDGISAAVLAGEDGVSAAVHAVAAEGGDEAVPLPVAAAANGDEGIVPVLAAADAVEEVPVPPIRFSVYIYDTIPNSGPATRNNEFVWCYSR